MHGDKLLCNLLDIVINYKFNIRYYKYLDAWKNFNEIFKLLDLDYFDLNDYFNTNQGTVYYASNSQELNYDMTRRITAESNIDLEEFKSLSNKSVVKQDSFR